MSNRETSVSWYYEVSAQRAASRVHLKSPRKRAVSTVPARADEVHNVTVNDIGGRKRGPHIFI